MIGPTAVRNIPDRLVLPSRAPVQQLPRLSRERDQITCEPNHVQQQEHSPDQHAFGDELAENTVGSHVDMLA